MRKPALVLLAVLGLGAAAPAGAETSLRLRPAGEAYVLSAADCAAVASANPSFGAACAALGTADPAASRAALAGCHLSANVYNTQWLTADLFLGGFYGEVACDAPLRPLACATVAAGAVSTPGAEATVLDPLGTSQVCGAATTGIVRYPSANVVLVAGVVNNVPVAQAFVVPG